MWGSPKLDSLPARRGSENRACLPARVHKIINYHMFQAGDTYGLIFALLLNRDLIKTGGAQEGECGPVPEEEEEAGEEAEEEGPPDVRYGAAFYRDALAYKGDEDYCRAVDRRLAYFEPFELLEDLVIVDCHFTDDVKTLAVGLEGESGKPLLVVANKTLFKSNPRLVSLWLTGQENDPSGQLAKLEEEVALMLCKSGAGGKQPHEEELAEAHRIMKGHADEQRARYAVAIRTALGSRGLATQFAYISSSTDYIRGLLGTQCPAWVSRVLSEAIRGSTAGCAAAVTQYTDDFIEKLLERYHEKRAAGGAYVNWPKKIEDDADQFTIVLCWIRAPRTDERLAIHGKGGANVGKPQHHTNMVLFKYLRHLTWRVGENTGKPFLFVPIGDVLDDAMFKKEAKPHNLIDFFRQDPFQGEPMAVQIRFLMELSARYNVIQVGMRSGSLERLMYLGIKTMYLDRSDEERHPGFGALVGVERIRQLASFSSGKVSDVAPTFTTTERKQRLGSLFGYLRSLKLGRVTRTFPYLMHLENRDTGFLKYSCTAYQVSKGFARLLQDELGVEKKDDMITRRIEALAHETIGIGQYNEIKQLLTHKGILRCHFELCEDLGSQPIEVQVACGMVNKALIVGGLTEEQRDVFEHALWFFGVGEQELGPVPEGGDLGDYLDRAPRNSIYAARFLRYWLAQYRAIEAVRAKRAAPKDDEEVEFSWSLFGEPDEEGSESSSV